MCCTEKEMAAEGKKLPTDRWFQVREVPCCIPPVQPEREAVQRERRTAQDTGIRCDRCRVNTLRLLRVLYRAEQHEGELLPVPVCELACPCGAQVALTAENVERLALLHGTMMTIPKEEPR